MATPRRGHRARSRYQRPSTGDLLLGIVNRFRKFARTVVASFVDDDCPVIAAAIAYYALLSIFPFLLAVATALARFLEQDRVRAAIEETLRTYLPVRARLLILVNMEEAIGLRGPVGSIAIVAFLWSSSAAIGTVRHSLNRIWGVERARPFWRRKLLEVVTTVLLGGILSAFVATSFGLALLAQLGWRLPFSAPSGLSPIVSLLAQIVTVVLVFVAFLVIYRVLPNRHLRWRWLWPGALIAAILLDGARRLAFWGLARFAQYQLVYGSLAGIIIFVLWMYVVGAILLLGAEICRHVADPDVRPQNG